MTNRLAHESSPYLRQHAENPVDWFPWGDEAFVRARAEDKPIFLSVGYSACHWCHVMARESFADAATAEILNRFYVAVKVDREERPDIDAISLQAVQALTGGGGWPLSVFLTPDGQPFYGGTYFPERPRHGLPAFRDVLLKVAQVWSERRQEIVRSGAALREALVQQTSALAGAPGGELRQSVLDDAVAGLSAAFDPAHGGFGGAPKFPQPPALELLLRRHLATGSASCLAMVTTTLDAMARGGIYDQLGGGFHRYAVDAIWLVPHFEKMLYDNAQLARLYLHAWQVTGAERYRRVARETLDYVLREMTGPSGGFFSAQDADTEGAEGGTYVWTPEQISAALPASDEDLALFCAAYGVTAAGNFEGKTILSAAADAAELAAARGLATEQVAARLAAARTQLLAARAQRPQPGRDDKVLASWNGLMLAAFAEAARALGDGRYLAAAQANAAFVLTQMQTADGRLRRTWRDGRATLNAYLEDYAALADGLLQLYQTDFAARWFVAARELGDAILAHFRDPAGGFFDTSDDHERLLLRPKDLQDGAQPSGGSLAATVLLQLAAFTGEGRYRDAAESAIAPLQPAMADIPLGFANWLCALDFALAPPREVAIVGPQPEPLLTALRAAWRPAVVAAAAADTAATPVPLLRGRAAIGGRAAAYVCAGTRCAPPVTTPAELAALLGPGAAAAPSATPGSGA